MVDSGWDTSRTTSDAPLNTSTRERSTISHSPTSRSSGTTRSPARPTRPRFPGAATLGKGRTSLTRYEHAHAVDAIHELLLAGECYQVNLTRRLDFDAAPDPFALFDAVAEANPAPHASVFTFGDALPGVAVVSASPELYLRVAGRAR